MNKQLRFLFFASAMILVSSSLVAQLPYVTRVLTYTWTGDEYFGKYWPENTPANVARAMDFAAQKANSSSPPMRLFEGCEDLKVRITLSAPVPEGQTVYFKFLFGSRPAGSLNTRAIMTIPDSVKIPNGVTYFEVPYTINHIPEAENGMEASIRGYVAKPDGSEFSGLTDYVNLFNRFSYDVEYQPTGPMFAGSLKLNVKGASPQVVCSLDGGYTWDDPHQEFTGAKMNKINDAGVIYIKEPNSCYLVTIPVGKNTGDVGGIEEPVLPSVTNRPVTIPFIADATLSHKGTHFVASSKSFVFTITPTGSKAGMVPVVHTDRVSLPDSEGVIVEDNGDGSYKVTIVRVQQPINISIDFTTGIESIDRDNKVWVSNNQLYISSSLSGIAEIYTVAGVLVKTVLISAEETTNIALPTGFYIIKLNDKSYKVVLK